MPLAAALLAAAALPAAAQQAPLPDQRLMLPMPAAPDWTTAGRTPPADPGASARLGPEPLLDCGRELPCRVRLRGILGRNGAVAVEGTAFTW